MDNLKSQILERIEHIEKSPLMYCSSGSYSSVSDLIFGYFLGINLTSQIDLNTQFTHWMNAKKTPATSLIWSGYILHIIADGNEDLAYKSLFIELKEFLKNN